MEATDKSEATASAMQSIKIGKPPQVVITPEFRHELDSVDPDHWVEVVPAGRSEEPLRATTAAEADEGEVFTHKKAVALAATEQADLGGEGTVAAREAEDTAGDVQDGVGYMEGAGDPAEVAAEEAAAGYETTDAAIGYGENHESADGYGDGYGDGYADPDEEADAEEAAAGYTTTDAALGYGESHETTDAGYETDDAEGYQTTVAPEGY